MPNFDQIRATLDQMLLRADQAFRLYRDKNYQAVLDLLRPEDVANENVDVDAPADEPNVFVPADAYDMYYRDYATNVIAACMDRLRVTSVEIEKMLELLNKAPALKEFLLSDSQNAADYAFKAFDWISYQKGKQDIHARYDYNEADAGIIPGLQEAFLRQSNIIEDVQSGVLNVTELHASVKEIKDLLSAICVHRFTACEIEYSHAEITLNTVEDFLKALADAGNNGGNHPQRALMEDFITQVMPLCRAHLLQVNSRLQDVSVMFNQREYAQERKIPLLPLEFPDFKL
jgi:hypothetical protein